MVTGFPIDPKVAQVLILGVIDGKLNAGFQYSGTLRNVEAVETHTCHLASLVEVKSQLEIAADKVHLAGGPFLGVIRRAINLDTTEGGRGAATATADPWNGADHEEVFACTGPAWPPPP